MIPKVGVAVTLAALVALVVSAGPAGAWDYRWNGYGSRGPVYHDYSGGGHVDHDYSNGGHVDHDYSGGGHVDHDYSYGGHIDRYYGPNGRETDVIYRSPNRFRYGSYYDRTHDTYGDHGRYYYPRRYGSGALSGWRASRDWRR